ncbi:MAG: DUF1501 domain-containing protein [Gemmataceae bacterium]|nr:DUF1501 domain-containing protein [Gemmataceae bacterium]MCS7269494.1 DUF1501 domain-containing protein [Gemmataceae bacterium]MDW8241897.1 DUF1501 domain-containing protein [Thermogemmata sp.]
MFGITDRRHFLQHSLAAAGLTLPGLEFLARVRAAAPEMRKKQKSLIILWMAGGPPTIDMFDMKPDSPNGGPHRPINTVVSGIQISEYLPKLAKVFNHLSIIRSLNSREGDHDRGTYVMNTGRQRDPLLDYPSIGSVLAYYQAMDIEAMRNADLPAFISVGGPRGGAGFLGMRYAPFNIQNPGQPPENVNSPVDEGRTARRAALFARIENGFQTNVPGDAATAHREVYEKALNMVVSTRKEVFSLDKELDGKPIDPKLKEEYGNTQFGRSALLARKLVEAGVACVQITMGGWDLHNNTHAALTRMLPTLDAAFATLVKDLYQRGKLQDTVLIWMGDFGRTPRINANAGRDHYSRAWSVVLGGGLIKGGVVYGETDKDGIAATKDEVSVLDLYATLYRGLGIDPTPETNASIRDNIGRPYYIAGEKPRWIKELVG